MKRTEDDYIFNSGKVVQKEVTLLRGARATFVSLVPHGANQRPFRVLKADVSKGVVNAVCTKRGPLASGAPDEHVYRVTGNGRRFVCRAKSKSHAMEKFFAVPKKTRKGLSNIPKKGQTLHSGMASGKKFKVVGHSGSKGNRYVHTDGGRAYHESQLGHTSSGWEVVDRPSSFKKIKKSEHFSVTPNRGARGGEGRLVVRPTTKVGRKLMRDHYHSNSADVDNHKQAKSFISSLHRASRKSDVPGKVVKNLNDAIVYADRASGEFKVRFKNHHPADVQDDETFLTDPDNLQGTSPKQRPRSVMDFTSPTPAWRRITGATVQKAANGLAHSPEAKKLFGRVVRHAQLSVRHGEKANRAITPKTAKYHRQLRDKHSSHFSKLRRQLNKMGYHAVTTSRGYRLAKPRMAK